MKTVSAPRLTAWLVVLITPLAAWAGPFGRSGHVKVRVPKAAAARWAARGGTVIADYESFVLVEIPDGSLDANDDAEVLPRESHILLDSGQIDTRLPAIKQLQRPRAAFAGKAMHMIQFAGPPQPEWVAELEKTGAAIVSYIPNNTYLIYGDHNQISKIQALSAKPEVQWDGPYEKDHKIHPHARANPNAKNPAPAPTNLYAIQLVQDAQANADTLNVINRMRMGPIRRSSRILQYLNIIVSLPPAKLDELAAQPDVISIQPYAERKLFDECQDQIVSGNLAGNVPSGPGYLAWLASQGFTQAQFTASGFAVDVSDSGIDNGTTSPNHFGLYVSGLRPGASRVVYNRLEGTPSVGSTLKGCDGHGNLNSHIIGGYDSLGGFPFADANGFKYGLGVAPFVKVGSSVIFDPNFTFPSYDILQSEAYHDNARVSSNSWGADNAGGYDIDAQTYDTLVRDAQPTGTTYPTFGNQQMVIVFANGNAGSGAQTVGTPATAKNVISVGAAENVRAFGGSDGSGVSDSGADNANDIISFSSRGPCADGRIKPDIVAPGTHVTGGVVQVASPGSNGTADACYNASGVSGGVGHASFFPSGQQFYTASSGTSHSTPAVAGGCALIRQFFINLGMAPPSPAMTKAFLMNSARYMTGVGANDTLPSNNQGVGEMNLGEAFNRAAVTPTLLRDQLAPDLFTATGQTRTFTGVIADNSKPLRVTLVWTDAPGLTSAAAYRNDLNLTVTVGGNTYKGNVFAGATSVTGGSADAKNNAESVFLPAGLSGSVMVTVTAANINSDGVPNFGGALDQDFALVGYNISAGAAPILVASASSVVSESCTPNGAPDPGEMVIVNLALSNIGTATSTNILATLQATGGVNSPSSPQDYGTIAPNDPPVSRAFRFVASGICGSPVTATLQVQDAGSFSGPAYFTFPLGSLSLANTFSQNFDSVSAPTLPSGWVAVVAQGSTTAWATTTAQRDTLPNAVFAPDPTTATDNRLTSPVIPITTASAILAFRHSYSFEWNSTTGLGYDGGVLEISIAGGASTDIVSAGGSFVTGGYITTLSASFGNPLANRNAWSGPSGGFITTKARLPASAAGQNIQLRWRVGTDTSVSSTGWYVDTITIAEPTCCSAPVIPPCNIPFADADGDADVDQSDFAIWQKCAGTYPSGYCYCFDRNLDGLINETDFTSFDLCVSGPDIPANPACAGP